MDNLEDRIISLEKIVNGEAKQIEVELRQLFPYNKINVYDVNTFSSYFLQWNAETKNYVYEDENVKLISNITTKSDHDKFIKYGKKIVKK